MTFFRQLSETVAEQVKWATTDHPRIGTGYEFFDSLCGGGAAEGEVILFTARPQVGKTAVACNVIRHNRHIPTVFFSLEMHGRYIAQRMAAIHSGVSTRTIEIELAETGKSPQLEQLVEDFQALTIIDKPGMTLAHMSQAMEETKQAWGTRPRLVVIDFLELIGSPGAIDALGQVDKTARKLKDFAREHDVVLMVLHQVGREAGGDGEKQLSLRSGRFGGEMSADYVLAAYRPCLAPNITQHEYESKQSEIWLQFLKTRGGSQIHPHGSRHRIDPVSMRITPDPIQLYRPRQPAMAGGGWHEGDF